jgi:hypothetical protein
MLMVIRPRRRRLLLAAASSSSLDTGVARKGWMSIILNSTYLILLDNLMFVVYS